LTLAGSAMLLSSVLMLLLTLAGSAMLLSSVLMLLLTLVGSAMLLSSVLMLLISVNKCYYRQATDVGATESSSSLGRASQLSAESPDASARQLVV